MNDQKPPSGGRTRTSTRQQSAPAGKGWDPMERCDWAAVAAVLPTPWPLGAQRHDLRYWASRQRAHEGDRPGYRALAERWGVSEKAARVVCADVGWWADPRFGDEDPKRAQQGRTKGAEGAHEGRTKGAPDPVPDDVINVKGRTKGAARAHEGRTKGAAGAPKDNSDRDTYNDTDTLEHTSASPPPAAGAAQLSLLSGAVDEVKAKPPKPTKAAREVEAAADLLARLDAMRLERHPGGRPLRPETWLPEVRRALRRQTPQGVIDGWTWLLRSPDAAWHRGEDRGGQDRTRDLKLLVAHPEYADRRTWRGLEAGHEHDIEQREPEAIAAPVFALTPYQIAVAAREERERLENEELRRQKAAMLDAQGDDDDLPF
jgi:hypothetical protein